MFRQSPLLQPEIELPKETDDIKIFKNVEELDPYNINENKADPESPKMSKFSKFLLIYGSGLIFFCFSLFVISFFTLFIKQGLGNIQFYLAVFLTLLFTFWSSRILSINWRFGAGAFLLMIISTIVSIFISRQFYDLSYDGQAYHGEAIIEILNGWNPIYEKAPGYNGLHGIWLDNYPKLAWLNQVGIYNLTHNWEDTKIYNFVVFLASAAISYAAIGVFQITKIQKIICTLALATSPLVILQSNGLLLDGQVSGLLLIILSQFIICYYYSNNFNLLSLVFSIVVFENTKTAGFVYSTIAIFVYICILAYNARSNAGKIIKYVCIGYVLGTMVFGFNPYVVNTIEKSNPVFPSLDKKVFDYTQNTPINYVKKSNLEIFASSIFFKTDKDFADTNGGAVIKMPFTFSSDEIDSLRVGGLKKGGFGPLFSGVFLVTLVALILALYNSIINSKIASKIINTNKDYVKPFNQWQLYFVIAGTIIFSCLLSSTSNTFRYIPQFWLLIGFSLIFAYKQKQFVISSIASIASIVILANTIICAYGNWIPQFNDTKTTSYMIADLKEVTKLNPIKINFGYQTATRLRLKDAGINFEEIAGTMDCDHTGGWKYFPENEADVCTN
jgi:hypothetical protein